MCGLFGFSNYGGEKIRDLADLTNSLARQSAVRGTDAAGIALCTLGNIKICKEAKPAYDIEFKHPDDVDELLNAGFTLEEIEDYIYRGCETDGEI